MRRRMKTVAPRGHCSSRLDGKSGPRSTGVASRGGSATPQPAPEPFPPAPLPVPLPAPPAPVPGPATSAAPCVGAVPARGVALAAMCWTGGSRITGLGATTGVAWLLMFLGAEPPSFSLTLGCCRGRGGGGGGGGGCRARSNTWKVASRAGVSILPARSRKTRNKTAWIATTAAIAPALSRGWTSERYATPVQRRLADRVAAAPQRECAGRDGTPGASLAPLLDRLAARARLPAAAVARLSALAGDLALL